MHLLRMLIILVLFSGLGFYVWRRLVHDTRLAGRQRLAATIGIAALVAPIVIANLLGGGGPPRMQGFVAWPAFLGWAIFALIFFGLLVVDLGRGVVWIGRRLARSQPIDPGRRQALARITGGVVTAVVAGEVAIGVASARGEVPVVDVPVALPRWPAAKDGYTIVQLTDLHVGATIDRAWVEDLVAAVNALDPDLVVLTGDLIDGSVADVGPALAPIRALRARDGVFAVTGNHEYYSGADAWIAFLRDQGVRVLRNERVALDGFDLAGIDDHSAGSHAAGHGADLARALAGRHPQRAVVLLAHQPRQVHGAAEHDVDLQLSGHTHGGQVWPWHYLVSLQQGGLLAGRYRIGGTELYVSRGAGYWGPPIRVGAPAEITRIVLSAQQPSNT